MTVDVVVLGKHVEVSNGVRDHTIAKVQRVEKFANDVRRIDVDYSAPHNRTRPVVECEILVHLTKHLVKGCGTSGDQRTALDLAFARVEEQLRRLHDRRTRRRNPRNARRDSAPHEAGDEEQLLAPDADAEDDGEILRVVKAKQFEVKPMPVEEAALQMELLGHDFFLFTSAESGRASVIYRRRDGLFGLIEATG